MPIIEITDSEAVRRCAVCGESCGLVIDEMRPTDEAGSILALPACPCGAVEFIIGAPEDEPEHPAEGSFGHRHRIVVDALVDVARRRAKGEVGGTLRAVVAERIGRNDLSKWFPDGLRLEANESTSDARERPTNKDAR